MIVLLVLLIPLLAGAVSIFIKNDGVAKTFCLLASLALLGCALAGVYSNDTASLNYNISWLPDLNSRFAIALDGMSRLLCLLAAVSLTIILVASWKNTYKNTGAFYGLLMLTVAGIIGVFISMDCLLFYFFWELALIPAYFLCSIWGGEKRIPVTFKFFIYTFTGSLLMLTGILYMYFKTPDHSFAWSSFAHATLSVTEQRWLFWMFFAAFAIKMPIFPFHTWQPDTYEQAPTAVTMLLSGVMVKMGVFGVVRWLVPLFPSSMEYYSHMVIILSIAGMIYASLIAIRQDDLKRLIAYSSIAHIGLMCAATFTRQAVGMQGVLIQMFNHGVNIIGMWIVADAIENKFGTRKFSELGGLAQKAPWLAVLLVIMALANIALPLTNGFTGEFLMFNGLFRYNIAYAAVAGITIILAAVYTLSMIQKIFYGNVAATLETAGESGLNVYLALAILCGLVLVLGVYPQPMIDLTNEGLKLVFASTK